VTPLLDALRDPAGLRDLPESQLPALCAELREEIVRVCGRVGGHLGASLGAVELIVALHRVFRSPRDPIVFDVGHQAYAHKLLTGRRAQLHTLRQQGGLSPFLDPTESPHDAFGAGHACTAVSVALGMLEARALTRKDGRVVAVIGDGALTGGLTFEALNNAATARAPLVVVLNDNQMSISENVGAISRLLKGPEARAFFEALGFTYLGPVDGHDLPALIAALGNARRSGRPVVVHARTQKGRGFAEAEGDVRTRGHAMGPFEWRDGKLVRSRGGRATFSEAFASALEAAMARDPRVVAVSPAMLEGSALVALKERFSDRVFDVGIAEQHAVAFCAGLARDGLRPVCAIYSTFLQRAVDQWIHDVCLPGLPVVLAVDRAGLVGADGATHQGAFDVPLLSAAPGATLMAPVVGEDVAPLLDHALCLVGPSALRFPRLTLPEVPEGFPLHAPPDRARWLLRCAPARATVVSFGHLGLGALEAARGFPDVAVLDARFAAPLDEDALREAARGGRVLTVEEGTGRGGFGGAVLEHYARSGLGPRVSQLCLPPTFIRHGDARTQRAALGLDREGIDAALRALLQ
jgi:1-deoxy-D-xylulose-5-phosphate synthase